MSLKSSLTFLAFASASLAWRCHNQFDGRIPAGSKPELFDTTNGLYDPDYVKGRGLAWSDILKIRRDVPPSLFDKGERSAPTLPIEVTLSDASIFAPSDTNVQTGFRRAELLPASVTGTDNSTVGVKTVHFSLRKDNLRPLNFSHEYQLFFLESDDYSTNQIVLKTGTIMDQPTPRPDTLQIWSNVRTPVKLFSVPFSPNTWHNFGLTLDFTANTTRVLYSQNYRPLSQVTHRVSNDVSGQGQYHFGLLKKPTGKNLTDVTKQGYQPSGIHEGIIFGGIFQEDSSTGCVTRI